MADAITIIITAIITTATGRIDEERGEDTMKQGNGKLI